MQAADVTDAHVPVIWFPSTVAEILHEQAFGFCGAISIDTAAFVMVPVSVPFDVVNPHVPESDEPDCEMFTTSEHAFARLGGHTEPPHCPPTATIDGCDGELQADAAATSNATDARATRAGIIGRV